VAHIQLVDDTTGEGRLLEVALGLSIAATPTVPASFMPTAVRGGVAISPGPLPSSPTPGTLAIDSNNGNILKWWTGANWLSAGS